ncbi:MAG: hypothetical protein ABIN97_13820 [Ginsengibacter sp.]
MKLFFMYAITPKKTWIRTLVLSLLLTSCHVMFIGAYDQVTDESIQKIQNDITTIIVKLERNFDNNNTAANKYENFRSSYENIAGEIESLKIRCGSLAKYQIISEQVNLLAENIKLFEEIHKLGLIDKQPVETIKTTFQTAFKAMIVLQNALKREKNK